MAYTKGADPDALDALSGRLNGHGATVAEMITTISGSLAALGREWGGADVRRLAAQLDREGLSALGSLRLDLREMADTLHRNAVAQRAASNSEVTSFGTVGSAWRGRSVKGSAVGDPLGDLRHPGTTTTRKWSATQFGPYSSLQLDETSTTVDANGKKTTTTTTTKAGGWQVGPGGYRSDTTGESRSTDDDGVHRGSGSSRTDRSLTVGDTTITGTSFGRNGDISRDLGTPKAGGGGDKFGDKLAGLGLKPEVGVSFADGKYNAIEPGGILDGNQSLWSVGGMKDGEGAVLAVGKVKAEGTYSVGINDGNAGLALGGSAAAYALYAEARGSTLDGHLTGGVKGYVGAEANGNASFGIGKDGLKAAGGVDAFVGGKAAADVGVNAYGVNAKVGGEVSYGLGFKAKGEASLSPTRIKASYDLGLTVGLGASVKFDIDVNPQEALNSIGNEIGGTVGETLHGASTALSDAGKATEKFVTNLLRWPTR